MVAFGFACLVVAVVIPQVGESRTEALLADAVTEHGVVTGSTRIPFVDWVTVEYSHRGQVRTGRVFLTADSRRYRSGQAVTVLVDPANPDRVTVVGEDNDPPWLVLPFVFSLIAGFIAVGSGFGVLRRVGRMEEVLARSTFVSVANGLTLDDPGRPMVTYSAAFDHPECDLPLKVAEGLKWRLGRSGLKEADSVEVAGDPTDWVVLRSPATGVLFLARLSARNRRRRRRQRPWAQ